MRWISSLWHLRLTVQCWFKETSIVPQIPTSTAQCNEELKLWGGQNLAHSCLLVTRKVKWEIQVAERDNADVRRGDRASREKCPHYVHGIHTELCRRHDTQVEEDKAFGDGCWMGHRGTRRSQYINRRPWFNQLLKGGGWGLGSWGWGGLDQTTYKSKSEVQPPLKEIWVYTFQTNKKKEAFLGFCENTKKMPSNWPTFESVCSS